jgi:hypothetical protein
VLGTSSSLNWGWIRHFDQSGNIDVSVWMVHYPLFPGLSDNHQYISLLQNAVAGKEAKLCQWVQTYNFGFFTAGIKPIICWWDRYHSHSLSPEWQKGVVFLLLWLWTWQLYFLENLHPPGHPLAAVLLRTAIKEMHCNVLIGS